MRYIKIILFYYIKTYIRINLILKNKNNKKIWIINAKFCLKKKKLKNIKKKNKIFKKYKFIIEVYL